MQYVKEAFCQAFRNMLTALVAELFVLLQIKVRTHKKDDDDEEEEEEERSSAVICEECGRSDRRHRLLVCIHCDSGYDITEQCVRSPGRSEKSYRHKHTSLSSVHEMMWTKIMTLGH